MPNYTCKCCNYSTHIKTHFTKHLATKKHIESTKSQPRVNQKSTLNEQISLKTNSIINLCEDVTPFQCKYCNKYFKFKQSMYKHIKYVCKKNDDEDFQELVRLLNEQLQEKNNQIEKLKDNMQKKINKLTSKLKIQNINNGTIHNTINMNIKLLNLVDTDYSHLTPKDYVMCIQDCNHCVKTLIEKTHFNKKKPENMNIFISSIKGNYMMVYKDNEWQIKNRKTQLDDLYEYNEMVLETWYDDYKEKYPHIISSFQRYLHNKDENDTLNKVKDEILLMLYNKRKLITNCNE